MNYKTLKYTTIGVVFAIPSFRRPVLTSERTDQNLGRFSFESGLLLIKRNG